MNHNVNQSKQNIKQNSKQNNSLYILGLSLLLLFISYFIINKTNSINNNISGANNSYIYNDIINMRIPNRG